MFLIYWLNHLLISAQIREDLHFRLGEELSYSEILLP